MKTEHGSSAQLQGSQYNWVTIALIVGAIVIFSNQKGCNLDLGNLLKPKNTVSDDLFIVPEPSAEFKTADLEAFRLEAGKNKEKAAYAAAFYYSFSDILSRNSDTIVTNQDFRKQHSAALDFLWKNTPTLSSPELGTEIEAYLDDFISLTPQKLDIQRVKNCLLALAWAAKNA